MDEFYNHSFDFENMTEQDVRETIVRPFLELLGYRHNTENNIRTEVSLRYSRIILGRPDPKSDPILRGRADYICEVISRGRWTVEAKAGNHDLTLEDSYQAHSYAVHPEIGGYFYLLTNGKAFRLYTASGADAPILEWSIADVPGRLIEIRNFISPIAISARAQLDAPDPHKPLGEALRSQAVIAGGYIQYDEYRSHSPAANAQMRQFQGHRATVVGEKASRMADGRIEARLVLKNALPFMDEMNKLAGIDGYTFSTSDEYVSADPEKPSIFQELANAEIPAGTAVGPNMFVPQRVILPVRIRMTMFTEAVGFLNGDCFGGSFQVRYDSRIDDLRMHFQDSATQFGQFNIVLK